MHKPDDTHKPAETHKPADAQHATGTGKSIGARLLDPDEPPPYLEERPGGRSNFVIVVDHASAYIPRRLNHLGVREEELERHIAWDIGALAVARRVSAALDAPLLAQNYSRLVIDCNRDPNVATSICTVSEHTAIPGNLNLSTEDAELRRTEIFEPYHDRIRALLDERQKAGRRTILVAQHSMTNIYKGNSRPMHAAVLYNRDRTFAHLVLEALRLEHGLVIGDNEPYFVSDDTDYTVPVHGEARKLPHVEIEIRQDLITREAGQTEWAARIVRTLREAEKALLGASDMSELET
jgi:predicted N-formylglutamate amidohydrolase